MEFHKKYSLLAFDDRKKIEECLKIGMRRAEIARILGRSSNTIKNEILRASEFGAYNAEKAHQKSILNKKEKYIRTSAVLKRRLADLPLVEIKSLLDQGYSTRALSLRYNCSRFKIKKFLTDNNLFSVTLKEKTFEEKLESLEMQVGILFEQIKELINEKANNKL